MKGTEHSIRCTGVSISKSTGPGLGFRAWLAVQRSTTNIYSTFNPQTRRRVSKLEDKLFILTDIPSGW